LSVDDIFDEASFISKKAKARLSAISGIGKCNTHLYSINFEAESTESRWRNPSIDEDVWDPENALLTAQIFPGDDPEKRAIAKGLSGHDQKGLAQAIFLVG